MDRREFLKIAGIAAGAAGVLFKKNPASARGIPVASLPGTPQGRCYRGVPRGVILTSLTDMFKIGPGPSSSHTIAPLRITCNFQEAIQQLSGDDMDAAQTIQVHLFGSLSATGKGHRTDRAILASLLGQRPETCDSKLMDELADTTRKYKTTINGKTFEIASDTLVWDKVEHNYPCTNTMVMRLVGKNGS